MNVKKEWEKKEKSRIVNSIRLFQVVPGGFEPPLTEPKTVVLPLHHRTIFVNCSAR